MKVVLIFRRQLLLWEEEKNPEPIFKTLFFPTTNLSHGKTNAAILWDRGHSKQSPSLEG
jgi:hypothetical protein